MGSINDIRNVTIELQKQTEYMRSIAQSCRAQAAIKYLDKMKECKLIDEETYIEEMRDLGKQLLGK